MLQRGLACSLRLGFGQSICSVGRLPLPLSLSALATPAVGSTRPHHHQLQAIAVFQRSFSGAILRAAQRQQQGNRQQPQHARHVLQQHLRQTGWQFGAPAPGVAVPRRYFRMERFILGLLSKPWFQKLLLRPGLLVGLLMSAVAAVGLLVVYLLFKVFGWWAFLLILLFPRSWRMIQRVLSRYRLVKTPTPRNLTERLYFSLDPHHPIVQRHLGRMPVFTSTDVGLEVQDEMSAIAPRAVQGLGGSGIMRVYLRSDRAIFELNPATDEWEATQDLEETLFVSRVTLQPTGQTEELDVTPESFFEEAEETQDTSERVVLDADFVVQDPNEAKNSGKNRSSSKDSNASQGRFRKGSRF